MNVTFTVTCPRCGSHLESVNNDDPKGWATRERRLVTTCTKRHCGWGGVIVVELIDLTHRKAVA